MTAVRRHRVVVSSRAPRPCATTPYGIDKPDRQSKGDDDMANGDTQPTDREQQPELPDRALDRRSFMGRVFLATGAAAFASMAGSVPFASSASAATATPTATSTATPPTGTTPGAATRTPTNQTIAEDFFGLTTDGRR